MFSLRLRLTILGCAGLVVHHWTSPLQAQTNQRASVARIEILIAPTGPDSLTPITGFAVLPDGRIVVGQGMKSAVRVFDRNGRPLRTLGKTGDHVRFGHIQTLGFVDRSIWVYDAAYRALVRFDSSLDWRSSTPILQVSFEGQVLQPVSFLTTGRMLATGIFTDVDLADGAQPSPLIVMDTTGRRPEKVDEWEHGRFVFVRRRGSGVVGMMRDGLLTATFSDEPIFRVSPDGRAIVVVERSSPSSNQTSEFRIRTFSPDGALLVQKSIRFVPKRVTSDVVDSVFDQMAAFLVELGDYSNTGAAKRALVERIPIPKYYPPVSGVVLSNDGSMWLRDPMGSATPDPQNSGMKVVRWTRVTPDGKATAFVSLPASIELLSAVGADTIYGARIEGQRAPVILRVSLHLE